MAQVRRLGLSIGGCLALFCIHCVNRGVWRPCSDFTDMLRHLINCRNNILLSQTDRQTDRRYNQFLPVTCSAAGVAAVAL